ncbi:MAG: flagellar biosynthetic protein FliO [Bacillota bacterium]|nr:flagellar biosynthetic protein FliO [Bacillota bacterium]
MDSMAQAALGIAVFAVILIVIGWLYKKLALSSKLSIKNSKYIKSLDRLIISNDKWIEIIQIGDETILIGVTSDSITKIKEIDGDNLNEFHEEKEGKTFSQFFEKYYKKTD